MQGDPVAGAAVYLLDRDLVPVPEGVIGEIAIGGEGVARGYLNQAALTADRFVPDPFAPAASGPAPRMYRTGDLGRWLPGGVLQWLGRSDSQVKIRGYRIEVAEIEAVLVAAPGVQEAVVLAPVGADGQRRLVAFVATRPSPVPLSEAAAVKAIRAHLAGLLPPYMIPAPIRRIDAMPCLANGKVDRQALLNLATQPDRPRPADAGTGVSPDPTEVALAGIWAEVIGVAVDGRDDDFFQVGGHSLSATSVASRVSRCFGIDFTISDVFESPTLAGMAEILRDRIDAAGAAATLATTTAVTAIGRSPARIGVSMAAEFTVEMPSDV